MIHGHEKRRVNNDIILKNNDFTINIQDMLNALCYIRKESNIRWSKYSLYGAKFRDIARKIPYLINKFNIG